MSFLRFFALFALLFSLLPAAAQQPEPGYDPDLYEGPPMHVPPPPPPAAEQGYVPRRWRAREQPTPVRLPVSPAVPASFFVGRWGQVSFNTAEDLPKMTGMARNFCNLPVTITQMSPNTFSMYVTTQMKEVQVFEQSGTLYVIPTEQLSDGVIRGARELRVLDNNSFTLRYLEDEAHRRYGPNVFVRCGTSRAAAPADGKKPAVKKKPVEAKPAEQAKP